MKAVDNGAKLRMNSRVTGISVKNGEVSGVEYIECGQKKYLSADIVISSMPIKELIQALQTEVPKEIYNAAVGLPYRDFVTVGLLTNKLKIKNNTHIKTFNELVPDCWIYVQDDSVKLGRIQIFNNWSPYMVKDFKNTVWLGLEYFCNEGDEIWRSGDKEFIDFAICELEKIGIVDKANIFGAHVERVKKAYPAYFDTYEHMDEIRRYLDSFNNLFCVGRNGQHRYNNMDHSMLTSFITVDEIVENSGAKYRKGEIWNVNTEGDYHEEENGE